MAQFRLRDSKQRSDQPTHGDDDDQFVDTFPDKYICSICSNVLRDAHLTDCCGQHFCASCLTYWLDTQQGRKTCPHCRQEDFQHMVNKSMIREVNELMSKTQCTNHKEGYGWVGERGERQSHLDSDKGCGYVEVACTNRCGERMSHKDLQAHLQEKCYYRPYECEYCGHKDTYKAVTVHHYSKCPEYPLDCPNRCGVTGVRRRAMPDHHSSCPLEPLDCPFKDAGCTEKIARKDKEDHITANLQKHMQLLQHSNQLLKQQLHTTKQELHNTKQDLHNVLQSIVGLSTIGDTLTFRVTYIPQLKKKKKAWHSPPFSIDGKVRVHLVVYPSGIRRGQGSHVSVSLILVEVVKKKRDMYLQYNVSVAAIGQHRAATHKTLELCTYIHTRKKNFLGHVQCSANFPFPSPGEVL